jgi:hypothetical protein
MSCVSPRQMLFRMIYIVVLLQLCLIYYFYLLFKFDITLACDTDINLILLLERSISRAVRPSCRKKNIANCKISMAINRSGW